MSDLPVRLRPRFAGLDSLRFFASVAVVATHCAFWSGFYSHGYLGALTSRLDIGVAFFFVLSAFLLSRQFLAALADDVELPSIGRYVWKRWLRVAPLAIITTVIALVTLSDNRGAGLGTWLRNLTLTELYFEGALPAGLTHFWSLTTEVAFYAALPVMVLGAAWFVRRRGWDARALLAAVLVILPTINAIWLWQFADRRLGAAQWLPGHLSWFAAGIALAIIQVDRERRPHAWQGVALLARMPGTAWIMAGALFAIAVTPIAGPVLLLAPTPAEAITKNLLYMLIASLVILPSALGPSHGTDYANALAHPLLRHLGLVSYGIFCLHLVVIHAVAHQLDFTLFTGHGLALFGLTIVITVVLAEVAYRLVEVPVMRLKDLRPPWSRKNENAAAPSAPTTNH